MDHEKPAVPLNPPRSLCPEGYTWSCTIMCDPGTRDPAARLFNGPGVEVCAVTQCHCVQIPPPPVWLNNAHQATSVQDLGLPIAFVIFGASYLITGGK